MSVIPFINSIQNDFPQLAEVETIGTGLVVKGLLALINSRWRLPHFLKVSMLRSFGDVKV